MKGKRRRNGLFLLLPLICFTMSSCGGGGSSSSETPPPVAESPAGIWIGTFTSNVVHVTYPVTGIIAEDNTARFITTSTLVQYSGALNVYGNAFSATVTAYAPVGTVFQDGSHGGLINISGTVSAKKFLSGTYAGTGDSGTFSFAYNPAYERPSVLTAIAGNWGVTMQGYTNRVSIDTSGNITGSSTSGCTYSGRVDIINPSYNAYNMTVIVNNCGVLNGSYTGLATLSDTSSINDTLITGLSNANNSITATFDRQPADVGVMLEATITPTYLNRNTKSVDAVQDQCTVGPPPTFEKFTDHSATVTISAKLFNPNTQFTPGVLYVEKYTIEYRRSNGSLEAPPIETDTRFDNTIIIVPPTSGTGVTSTTATVLFLDLKRKDKYFSDMKSGQFSSGLAFLNNYTAIYTFEGKNAFGESFSFKVQTDFVIGNFNNC